MNHSFETFFELNKPDEVFLSKFSTMVDLFLVAKFMVWREYQNCWALFVIHL